MPEDTTTAPPPPKDPERFDLLTALEDDNYVAQWDSAHPNSGPRAFSSGLNAKLSKPIDTAAGESIFDSAVMSRYFDDASVPDADKEAIAFAFKPSLAVAAFDEQIRQSVGEPVRSKGLLGRAISNVIDVAGKPIGRVFDALEYPADRAEQFFGTVLSYGYDSDLSLSERWKMGRLTFEAYGQTGWWKFKGDDKLNEWSQQVATGEKTWDEIMEEHEHGVPDLVGKMILDPLWLLGGVPGIPGRLFKAGEKGAQVYKTSPAATFFRGLSEGIRLESLGSPGIRIAGAIRGTPIVGKPIYRATRLLFGETLPTEQKIFNTAIADWRLRVAASEADDVITSWRDGKGLFQMTPQAKADEVFTHLSIAATLARGSQDDIIQLARAIETQKLDAVPEVFGQAAFRSKAGRVLFQALKEQGVEMRRFPSMMKAIADPAIWDNADAAARAGMHKDADAFIAAFQEDLHNIAYPALQRWHGVDGTVERVKLKSGETVERFVTRPSVIQKFTNGLKFWLSTTLLNKPGFVGVNYTNNGAALAADWGIARGARYWTDPLGRKGHLEGGLKELLEEAGLNPAAIKTLVGDRSVQREMLGLNTLDDKLLGISKTTWAPMVALTSQFDMGARMHAFYEMFARARNAIWKFEGTARGVLPDVPPPLAAHLGPDLTARLRGAILAAGPDAEKLRAIADDMVRHGRPPLTAEHFIEKLADDLDLEGDARQAFNDMFEPAFRTRISAILADAGSDTNRLRSRLDTLRGALRQQEHQARELDNLMPRPRDYRNLPVAAADHEALMAERDKVLLIQLRRFLTATGVDPSPALREFATIQNAARQRRYVLQYVAQLLDISPERLESNVMFQLVPESLRPAVKEAHRELVLGLDEITPERGEFFEVLGDLAARWEKHSEQTAADLTDFFVSHGQGGPMQSFVEAIAGVEGRVAQARDRVFADMIENHPGADASTDVAEWVGSRWSQHYRELDNIYNEALESEAAIFGFEHRMPPHARGGENPTVGEMLGVRNSQLEQFMDYVEKQHLLERDAHVFVPPTPRIGPMVESFLSSLTGEQRATIDTWKQPLQLVGYRTHPRPELSGLGGARYFATTAADSQATAAALQGAGLYAAVGLPEALRTSRETINLKNALITDEDWFEVGRRLGLPDAAEEKDILQALQALGFDGGQWIDPETGFKTVFVFDRRTNVADLDLATVYHGSGGPIEGSTLREGTFVTTDRAAAQKYAEIDARARRAAGEKGAAPIVSEWKIPKADLGDAPADATNLGSPLVLRRAAERKPAGFLGNVDELTSYLDEVAAIAPDARFLQSMTARRAADFTMLNYDRRYGIDHWMALVYPYAFWPTRSMWHWAQRGISRPGAVAATAKLYDLINEVNTDAGVPERFRNSIRIPIPFLDKALGQSGTIYFDPIKVLFPTADWSYDDNFDDTEGGGGTFLGVPRNTFAAINQWAKVVGPGVNPFIDTALQYAAGDERALYIKYRLSSLPFMIPGPRQLQAMWSFTQSGEDPDGALDDETKEALAQGKHLPDDKLKQALGMDDDEFDLYRTQRVLANQVFDDDFKAAPIEERKARVRAALVAAFTRRGSTWNNARKIAQKESGLSITTGWLFGVPIRQYPNGEATSRGIQEMYREVQELSRELGAPGSDEFYRNAAKEFGITEAEARKLITGGDVTAAFTEMFPEIEVRDAALAIFDGTDKQDSEIASTLFAMDLDRVHKMYDQRIADLNGQLESLSRTGALTTEEGRRAYDVLETERNAITEERSLEIDDLDKRYEDRNQEPSLSRTPRTRALQELERAYYAIELPDQATDIDFQKQRAQQQAFLEALPEERDYSPFGDAVNHYATLKSFDRQITAAYDRGDRDAAQKLVEDRQQLVIARTAETKSLVTRKEFEQYLARNRRVPTTEELERDQASAQISEYFAIKERASEIGYTSREAAEIAGAFWDAHPLLQKYYGGPDISVDTYEDIVAYDRMETIWESFYSLEGSSQARIDYLAMVIDELNELRRRFGLKPVKITDPYWNQEAPPPRYEGSDPRGY